MVSPRGDPYGRGSPPSVRSDLGSLPYTSLGYPLGGYHPERVTPDPWSWSLRSPYGLTVTIQGTPWTSPARAQPRVCHGARLDDSPRVDSRSRLALPPPELSDVTWSLPDETMEESTDT